MEKPRKNGCLACICSFFYLLAAIGLLLSVCGYCYPAFGQWAQTWIAGREDSPVREAFHVFSDGLEAGSTLKEAAKNSFYVLTEDAD